MGGGDYILSTSWGDFMNVGLQDPRLHLDHRMMLAVIHGEGKVRNSRY